MSTNPNPLATLPLRPSPQVPLPPQVQQMLAQASQNAQQPEEQTPAPTTIPPITSTPEYQAVEQAGQGSLGVPGFNAQGQAEPATGAMGRLKRALSDAVFAIGEGLTGGVGAGIMAATPQGRTYIHQQRQLEAEAAKAQEIGQLGQGMGREGMMYARMAASMAAQDRAKSYGQYVNALAPKFQAEIQNLGARTALASMQTELAPQEFQLKSLATRVQALYKQGMLAVEQNRTAILQQATDIKQSLLPYQQALMGSITQLNNLGQYDKAAEVANAYAEMSGIINKVDIFDNQIMHPELVDQAMQQIKGAVDSYNKLFPQMVNKIQQNNAPRPAAPAPTAPQGMVTMRGPKGIFHVPAANVPILTKNGYKVVGR